MTEYTFKEVATACGWERPTFQERLNELFTVDGLVRMDGNKPMLNKAVLEQAANSGALGGKLAAYATDGGRTQHERELDDNIPAFDGTPANPAPANDPVPAEPVLPTKPEPEELAQQAELAVAAVTSDLAVDEKALEKQLGRPDDAPQPAAVKAPVKAVKAVKPKEDKANTVGTTGVGAEEPRPVPTTKQPKKEPVDDGRVIFELNRSSLKRVLASFAVAQRATADMLDALREGLED